MKEKILAVLYEELAGLYRDFVAGHLKKSEYEHYVQATETAIELTKGVK